MFNNKTKEFKLGSILSFDLKIPPEDSLYKVFSRTTLGKLISIDSSSMEELVIFDELQAYSFKEGLDLTSSKQQNKNQQSFKMKIRFNEINSIRYQGKSTKFADRMSTFTLVSLGTTLIVAPLVSINYDNGDFNSKLYYKVAGYSLLATGVTTFFGWITSLNKRNSYYVNSDSGIKKKNKWTVSLGR